MTWRLLLALAIGMGLGRALADWPGDVYASGATLVVSVVAFVACVRAIRKEVLDV